MPTESGVAKAKHIGQLITDEYTLGTTAQTTSGTTLLVSEPLRAQWHRYGFA